MEQATLSSHLLVPREAVNPSHFNEFTYYLTDGYTQEEAQIETFESQYLFWAFHRGDLPKIRRVFGRDVEIVDERVAAPFDFRLRWTKDPGKRLREGQRDPLHEWIAHGFGQLEAPPRWGKTVWMTALMVKLRQRTLMIAHLVDLAYQLEETIRQFTNINELEEERGEQLCGVIEDWSKKEKPYPITLSTYQRFAVSATGRKVIKRWADEFGLVVVDECHRCSTELYTEVVGRLNAAYRCGVTATPTRKDGMHVVVNDVLGPVVTKGLGEQLTVHWSWEETGILVQPFGNWMTMWKRLAAKKSRNKKIAKKVIEDVRAGHFVLVTTELISHLHALREAINDIDCDITVGELYGQTKNRKKFRDEIRRGEYQVVIAMNRIVQLGYNVPRWSCFHNTLPMTNKQNWYQRISRVRTPMEPAFPGDDWEKPQPVARVWCDFGENATWAYRHCVKKENDRLGFVCLNPKPTRKRGKRKGVTGYVAEEEDDAS